MGYGLGLRASILGLFLSFGIATSAHAETQVQSAPPDYDDLVAILPQLDQVGLELLEKYSPETHAFIFVGRSPTALRDYLIMVGKSRFQSYQIPVSGLSDIHLSSDTVKDKADALFKEWLPPAKDLQGKKLVILDYTNTQANSLLRFKGLLQDYAKRTKYDLPTEVSTVALRWHGDLEPKDRGAIEGVDLIMDFNRDALYGKMLNFSRFREVAPVPFFDLLRTRKVPVRERKLTFARMSYLRSFKELINLYGVGNSRKAFKLPAPKPPMWEDSACFVPLAGAAAVGVFVGLGSLGLTDSTEEPNPSKSLAGASQPNSSRSKIEQRLNKDRPSPAQPPAY